MHAVGLTSHQKSSINDGGPSTDFSTSATSTSLPVPQWLPPPPRQLSLPTTGNAAYEACLIHVEAIRHPAHRLGIMHATPLLVVDRASH